MGIEFLGDSCNLLNTILVSGEVRLEGLMFLLEGLELIKLAVTEVLALEHILLPAVHASWMSALCLNFLARCSRRSSLIISASSHSSKDFSQPSRFFQALATSVTDLPSEGR